MAMQGQHKALVYPCLPVQHSLADGTSEQCTRTSVEQA